MADRTPAMEGIVTKLEDARRTIYGFGPEGAVLLLCEAVQALARDVEQLRALVEGDARG